MLTTHIRQLTSPNESRLKSDQVDAFFQSYRKLNLVAWCNWHLGQCWRDGDVNPRRREKLSRRAILRKR